MTLTYTAADNLTFKSITGYRTNVEHSLNNLGTALPFVQFIPTSAFDGVGTDVPAGTVGGAAASIADADIDQEQFSQELQVIGSIGKIDFTGGLFYFYETVDDVRESLFNISYVYGGTPGVLAPISVQPFRLSPSRINYRGRADSYAAYAQATWTVPGTEDRLKLTGGLRYTHDKKRFVRRFFLSGPDNSIAPIFDDKRFDPALTIAYQLTDTVNVYGRYASAYRSGGVPIRNKLALTTYEPEINKSFEIGFKSQLFDRRLRWNVAAFSSRVKGTQISSPNIIADPSSQSYINLPGTVKITGFESEMTIAPFAGLVLGINYAYLHVKAPATVPTARGPLPFVPPNAPKHTLSLAADYEIAITDDLNLLAHVDYSYISNYTLSPLVQPFTETSPMGLHSTNAKVGVDDIPLGSARAYFGIYGRNIFNVADDSFTFNTGTNDFTVAPGGSGYAVAPRTYGLEARIKF